MRVTWRSLADWFWWRFVPFAEDHPLLTWILAFPILILFKAAWTFFREGADASFTLLEVFAIGYGWFYAAVFAWWLQGWEIRRTKERVERLRANQICLNCGYDLRATPERCPECGKRPEDLIDLF